MNQKDSLFKLFLSILKIQKKWIVISVSLITVSVLGVAKEPDKAVNMPVEEELPADITF